MSKVASSACCPYPYVLVAVAVDVLACRAAQVENF